MEYLAKNRWTVAAWLASCFFLLWVAISSTGNFQTGDTHVHYLIARFAKQYPELYLDLWGKPLFTLLYSAVAPFGYTAAKIFTVFWAAVALWQSARLADLLGLKWSFLVPVLVGFSPMFVWMSASCMTEVLFAAWLVSGILFLAQKRWWSGVIFLSFLPFIRSEGFILLPFIALYPIAQKVYRVVPFFCLGTVLYSAIGAAAGHSVFWVFTENPYPLVVEFYGKGDALRFLSTGKTTWGLPLFLLWIGGFMVTILQRSKQDQWKEWWWLVLVPFVVFITFHSVAWATGTFASVGELRVLVCTMPLAGVLAMRAISLIPTTWKVVSSFLVIALCVNTAWVMVKPPIAPGQEEQVMGRVADFIAENHASAKVWCMNTQIAVALDKDPWLNSSYSRYYPPISDMPRLFLPGDVVVWDAHFSPNEGQVPEQVFFEDKDLIHLQSFEPDVPFTALGGKSFIVHVFLKK